MLDIPDFETFCADPQLLGEPISPAWVTFYRAVEGLSLAEEGVELFRKCTGRDKYEPRVYNMVTAIIGRRGEKTSTAVKFLLWKALFTDLPNASFLRRVTRTKRRLYIPLVAQDVRVSNDIKRTLENLIMDSPVLREEVDEIRVNEVILRNNTSFINLPAGKAFSRGFPCPFCLLDEYAWVTIDGADDKELQRSVIPSMIQFGAARRLIKASTPWLSDSGVIADDYKHRAARPDVLVWQASTQTMTPRIDPAELEKERLADPQYFAREFLAEFSSGDLEAFLPSQDIHVAVRQWREMAPAPGPHYVAALDASGLTGGDTFTFGIASNDENGIVVSVLRGWRRGSAGAVIDEIASLCREYRIQSVEADQFSYTFLAELFRPRDIILSQLAFTARSKPELFFDLKNALSQARIALPNNPDMVRELRALEALRTSGGGYKIGAPRGMHDDFCAVLALLANRIKRSKAKFFQPTTIEIAVGRGASLSPRPWVDPKSGKDLYDATLDLPNDNWMKLRRS